MDVIFDIIINFIIDIFCAYVTADFLVGVFHWFKDTYFTPHTVLIGKQIIWSSRLHHLRPKYVEEFSDWDLAKSSGVWTLSWFGPYVWLCGLSIFNIALFIFISLNDVVHKYAHMSDTDKPAWASVLQKYWIMQSHDEHHQHHVAPHMINYCAITPYLNGLLERINFWRRLEGLIESKFGIKPRDSTDDFVEDENFPAGVRFLGPEEPRTPATPRRVE